MLIVTSLLAASGVQERLGHLQAHDASAGLTEQARVDALALQDDLGLRTRQEDRVVVTRLDLNGAIQRLRDGTVALHGVVRGDEDLADRQEPRVVLTALARADA